MRRHELPARVQKADRARGGDLARALVSTALLLFACFACRTSSSEERPLRVAVRGGPQAITQLSSLSYRGGFDLKTLVYETLVRRDARGAIAPGFATAWRFEDEGKRLVLTLREHARFHDGSKADAHAVAQHMRRWVGLPEHAWLLASRCIERVDVRDPRTLVLQLSSAADVLPDLCAVNPCAVRAPSSVDREGAFVAPIGSGPFGWLGADDDGRIVRLAPFDQARGELVRERAIEVLRIDPADTRDVLELLVAGEIDACADSWQERLPRERFEELARDERFVTSRASGSSVHYVTFQNQRGPCADLALRRALRDALDRDELIRRVERGHADPCTTWAAPSIAAWPRGAMHDATARRDLTVRLGVTSPPTRATCRLLVSAEDAHQAALATELARQWNAAGLPVRVETLTKAAHAAALEAGDYDLRLEETWGVPFDPDLSLSQRFGTRVDFPTAARPIAFGRDAMLAELVDEYRRTHDEASRTAQREKIQARLDEQVLALPLFVPHRLGIVRRGFGTLSLDHDVYRTDLRGLEHPAFTEPPDGARREPAD